MTAPVLAAAAALDAWAGEPAWLWSRLPHPAVLMGRAIGWMDRRFNRGAERWTRGIALTALGAAAALTLGAVLAAALARVPGGQLAELVIVAILLAQRSLADHVKAVADALEVDLSQGRAAVARIVGRDTASLDEAGVARAAIESAAENFSDGVVAPALWYLLGGLPGILLYKFVNTADSMIGYRTPRHAQFGWAAARLDDVLNWPAARLTAALLWLATGARAHWRQIRDDAALHRSPNAGWPEAAMAGGLGVALAGPRVYHGQRSTDPFVFAEGARDIGAAEIRAALRILWRAWAIGLAGVALWAATA